MERSSFSYVTYINATPEKVWQALIDPEMTRRYWGNHRNASDWKTGSTWVHQDYDDETIVDLVGKVLETTSPRRLVLTWAFPADQANEARHSRVTFEIEPFLDYVRLTLLHEDLEPGSEMLAGITMGWPAVLSSLKTLLETGEPLPHTDERWHGPPEERRGLFQQSSRWSSPAVVAARRTASHGESLKSRRIREAPLRVLLAWLPDEDSNLEPIG